jgi:serralysin
MRGRDLLTGGLGADRLCGGWGADRFRFRDVADSAAGDADTILAAHGRAFDDPGAAEGDMIVLRRLDADTTVAGDQAFRFDDSEAAGTLRCVDAGAVTRVLGFTDGVAGADFELLILDRKVDAASYTEADFVL